MYWAQALAEQDEDIGLKNTFKPIADALTANELKIVDELNAAQGKPVEIGGYYQLDEQKANKAMRPGETLNAILERI